MKELPVFESVHAQNEVRAAALKAAFSAASVLAVNVMGAPGIGKTTVIERLAEALPCPCSVIEGDIQSDLDTLRLREAGVPSVQINTGGACHLEPAQIEEAVAKAAPASGSVLFIENIGNLVCPAEFEIGEHVKMLICSVTDGSDKPYKYPLAFEKADLIVLNKIDLLPHLDFDEDFFLKGVRALNPGVAVFKTDARKNTGLKEVSDWLSSAQQSLTNR